MNSNNDIENWHFFGALLEGSCAKNAQKILFETYKIKITYREFYEKVQESVELLSEMHDQYIRIDSDDTIDFAVKLFSTVISGNIACINNVKGSVSKAFAKQNLKTWEECCSSEKKYTHSKHFRMKLVCYPSDPDKISIILCSSGTTSEPKGICLTERNVCSCTLSGIKMLPYLFGWRFVSILPMNHAFGLVADLLGAIYVGGTLCIPDNFSQFLSCLPIFQPDIVNLPPAGAEILLKYLRTRKEKSEIITGGRLKRIMCAGAPLNLKTIIGLREYGIEALSAYGLTECSPCISMNSEHYHKDESCGRILENNTVIIANDGEILVSGFGVMKGYLDDPNMTKEVMDGNYLHTGDLGYLDQDGFLYVTGRKNNMIIFTDGTKLIPEVLEAELNSWDAIRECLVWGRGNTLGLDVVVVDSFGECCEDSIKDPEIDLKEKLKSYVMSETNHYTDTITISKKLLSRNGNGKLIRNRSLER